MSHSSAHAPGRVELLGNHTDYNEGVVLAAAIDYRVSVAGDPIPVPRVVLQSTSADQPIDVPLTGFAPFQDEESAWANYALGVVSCLQQEQFPIGGFRMSIDSDLPVGAGLSSSAALEVATARLLMKLFGLEIDPLRLAKICRRAENDFVGVQCGLLDQVSSIFGKRGQAVYLDCRSEVVENIPLPPHTSLLVFHCGAEHRLVGGAWTK